MEHVFSIIATPKIMGILKISGTMNKKHGRIIFVRDLWLIYSCIYGLSIRSDKRRDLWSIPYFTVKFRSRTSGQLIYGIQIRLFCKVKLPRLIGKRIPKSKILLIRRKDQLMCSIRYQKRFHLPINNIQTIDLSISRMTLVTGNIKIMG